MKPYLCPNCKTNRSRFNKIEQTATSMKLDPGTGELIEQFDASEEGNPFHIAYKGPSYLIQCGVCSLIGEESQFAKYAESHPRRI
ncbi:DNA alkylation repair protein [Pseudalkalibacillus caeni]|uniref:DNA alkylation repair protein n=1 Tax=Exobacillus caeni TaxID=2574798 RepID=A0A5R9EX76_9BACL|nr:DNA alkylation repair protein [Pseudalkalibacillus caeni]TLS35872.1 DNA alkylation repair protein [Pseudalkalibacillus caeni]